ncbi:MAG: tRNA 2-thiouridine(34) synthase MnmA [candidate division WOR-3 bacterium]
MRVVVAMSGGVDSAVAVALLKEQGHEVIGITMRLYDERSEESGARGCCGLGAIDDARRVAARLEIPFYALDLRREFERLVIEEFCSEYARGRTPNPCIRCNEAVKFRLLAEKAMQFGAEALATGHHARLERDGNGTWHLRKGVDQNKDQSYFLYQLTQEQMARILMPVGDYSKEAVREKARNLSLPVAEKPESQEICFVPDGDHVAFLRMRRPELFRPGPVYDTRGRLLGEHQGIAAFTLGQRKGLGIALGERHYVVRLDVERNAVILGTEAEAYGIRVLAARASWVSGKNPDRPFRAWAKVRYQSPGGEALVEPLDACQVRVTFDEPQWAPTPGQAVVFWQGDEVVGGAVIESGPGE